MAIMAIEMCPVVAPASIVAPADTVAPADAVARTKGGDTTEKGAERVPNFTTEARSKRLAWTEILNANVLVGVPEL